MLLNEELDYLIDVLPKPLQPLILDHPLKDTLVEVVLDLGRRPEARFFTHPEYLSSKLITWQDLDYCTKRLSKFSDDVAVVYIFGKKDAGRLSGGKYFKDYKSNKDNLKGHQEHGYIMVAPHVAMNISGVEISGTGIRQ